MKRLLYLLIALAMCVALFSCGEKAVQGNLPVVSAKNGVNGENAKEKIDLATVWNGSLEHSDAEGFYDPNYDYGANPRYKVCAFADATYTNLDKYDEAIAHWCEKMNLQYDGLIMAKSINEEEDLAQIAQEYDGVIIVGSSNHKNASYAEILNNSDCAWMSCREMRDYDTDGAPILRPVLSYGDMGLTQLVSYMKTYIEENLTDVDPSEIGIFYTAYTNLETVENLEQMFLAEIKNQLPEFWGDLESPIPEDWGSLVRVEMNTGTIDYSTEYLYNKAIMENPQFKYWLFVPFIGSVNYDISDAIEANGLTETSAVFSRNDPYETWQVNGYEVYKAVYNLPLILDVEPIVGALYAFMNGDAAPETIWGGDENGYGVYENDRFCLVTKENHIDFLHKVNEYAGGTVYDLGEEAVSEDEEYTDEYYEPKAPDYRYDYYANEYNPNAAPFRYEDVADKTVIATYDGTERAPSQYQSVTELSKASPVIVAGEIIDIRYIEDLPGTTWLNPAYTIYDIKITETVHGDYKVGDIISVFEYGGYIRSAEYNRGGYSYEFDDGVLPLIMKENEVAFVNHHAFAPTSEIGDICVMFLTYRDGIANDHEWSNTGAWSGKFIVDEEGNVSRWSEDLQKFEVWGTYDELMKIAKNTAYDENTYDYREIIKP